jgi:hypothetical protein
VGDRTIKKRPRFAAFAPTPDSLLAKAAAANQMETTVADGLATPAGSTTNADLTAIGEASGRCAGDEQGWMRCWCWSARAAVLVVFLTPGW